MALLDERTRDFLKDKLHEELTRAVTVEIFTDERNAETSEFAINLMRELSELHSALRYEVRELDESARAEGIEASPTLRIGHALGYGIEYWGAPLGLEAEGFIETLSLVSRGDSGLGPLSDDLLELLERDVRVYSFVTPTCPHCPRSVVQNHRLAVSLPRRVRSIAVEAQENLELARRFQVSSVPQQMFDEDPTTVTVGAQPERSYVRSLLEYSGVAPELIERREAAITATVSAGLPAAPGAPFAVSDDTLAAAVQRYPVLVVDFWASWCGPCQRLAPVLEELAAELQGRVAFAKLNTEVNPTASATYSVSSIPSLLVFVNGKLKQRLVGFKPAEALRREIEALLPALN